VTNVPKDMSAFEVVQWFNASLVATGGGCTHVSFCNPDARFPHTLSAVVSFASIEHATIALELKGKCMRRAGFPLKLKFASSKADREKRR